MEDVKNILVDARTIGTGTGNYAEGILDELQKLDTKNRYIVVLDPSAKWRSVASNFKVYSSKNTDRRHKFFLRGNVQLAIELRRLKFSDYFSNASKAGGADILWETFQHLPFLYSFWLPFVPRPGKVLLSVLDLTQLRIKNIKSKDEKRAAWKKDKLEVIKTKIRKLPFSLLPYGFLQWLLNIFGLRRSVWQAEHIFVISKFVQQDVKEFFKLKPRDISLTVVGGVAEIEKASKLEPVAKLKGKEFLLYVGTDHGHKNLISVVEAMAREPLKSSKKDLYFVMAGAQDRNYLTILNRAKELGLGSRVIHLGWVSDGVRSWLYKNASLYVFPSLSEGFGMPALESMAHKLPVVASNRTAIPEVCGKAAVYFDPADYDDISKTIYKVIDDSKLRAKMQAEGLKRNQFYRWEDSANEVLNQITKLKGSDSK
jgi:glycosyltransferase involved in cell wall biosynthesis